MQTVLINLGHTPIIEEFIPEELKEPIPYEEIRKNIQLSNAVFLFLTDEIVRTEYTRNWVIYEVGLASERQIPLFVFERKGFPIPYPIPYVTDFMLFDPHSIDDLLDIQKLASGMGKIPPNFLTAGFGALIGAAFGPLGIALGGLGGLIFGPKRKPPIPGIQIQCYYCNTIINYWSPNIVNFNCPICRKAFEIGGLTHV